MPETARNSQADVIYRGGRIYTGDPDNPWVDSVAICDDRFIAVGDVDNLEGSDTEVIDLGGLFVMPGMYDMHVHPDLMLEPKYTGQIQTAPLGPKDLEDALRSWDVDHPGDGWIFGGTWFEPDFREQGVQPGLSYLDRIVAHRPVAILDSGRHVLMVNSVAMRVAEVDSGTFEPDHGKIYREPSSGELTGVFADGAQSLFSDVLPQAGWAEMAQVYAEGEAVLNSFGFVGARSVHVNTTRLQGLQAHHRTSGPNLRWEMAISWKNDLFFSVPDRAALMTGERFRFRTKHVNANLVKFHLDGTPASLTGFFLEPYKVDPDNYGRLNESPEEVVDLMVDLDRQGVTVVLHVIGDAAARVALDGIEAARKANGPDGPRHTLAHCTFLHPDDAVRIGPLGVVAEFSHTLISPQYIDSVPALASRYFEQSTVDRFIDVAGLLDADGVGVLGSDWVVTPTPEVFPSLQELVIRDRTPGRPISVGAAITMLTANGAYAMGLEEKAGSIQVGRLADLIVLDRNVFEIDPAEIGATRVLRTVFEGRTVFEAEPLPSS